MCVTTVHDTYNVSPIDIIGKEGTPSLAHDTLPRIPEFEIQLAFDVGELRRGVITFYVANCCITMFFLFAKCCYTMPPTVPNASK